MHSTPSYVGLMNESIDDKRCTIDWGDRRTVFSAFQECSGRLVCSMGASDTLLEMQKWFDFEVIAVSPYASEHALYWLKRSAVNHMHPDRRFNLLGIHPAGRRVFEYHSLRSDLPKFAQEWWDQQEGQIRTGILYSGALEISYQSWWERFERWVGIWNWENTLMEHQAHVLQLWKRPRWRLFDRLYSELWVDTWQTQISTQQIKGIYWLPPSYRTVDSYEDGPSSLSPKETTSSMSQLSDLRLIHDSMTHFLSSQSSSSISGIYLGELQHLSAELSKQVVRTLASGGRVLVWHHQKPKDEHGLRWSLYSSEYQGFLVGKPWVAIKG